MSKHQYRLDLQTLQLRNFHRELIPTIVPDRDFRATAFTADGARLEWNQISLWHGVYGWTLSDGSVAVRYVPGDSKGEYLITVERPIEDELRVIAAGANLLRTAATDFAAWSAVAGTVEMRR